MNLCSGWSAAVQCNEFWFSDSVTDIHIIPVFLPLSRVSFMSELLLSWASSEICSANWSLRSWRVSWLPTCSHTAHTHKSPLKLFDLEVHAWHWERSKAVCWSLDNRLAADFLRGYTTVWNLNLHNGEENVKTMKWTWKQTCFYGNATITIKTAFTVIV